MINLTVVRLVLKATLRVRAVVMLAVTAINSVAIHLCPDFNC